MAESTTPGGTPTASGATAPSTTTPAVPPPIEAQETGPVSEQEVGAIPATGRPAEAAPTGPIGTSEELATGEATPKTATPLIAAAAATAVQQAQPAKAAPTQQVAQRITQAISLGLATLPSNAGEWAQLVDTFSSAGGEDELQAAEEQAAGGSTKTPTAATSTGSTQGTGQGPTGLAKFLGAIRQHESGGDYTAYNAGGGASGAYQFIQSTWDSEAAAAGYGQYAGKPAGTAPPSVQDAVAAHMATGYWNQYHTWADVAESWYTPSAVGKDVVPAPTAGNTESVTAYGQQIVQMMGQQPTQDAHAPLAGSTDSVVKIAQGQLGVPYQWGGESPGKDFDCSGLVQWVYKQAGVTLPRVAQTQYNATAKLAPTVKLQPGDLLFFGQGPNGVSHVGLYIGNGQMIDAPHTGADVRVDMVFPGLAQNPNGPPGKSSWGDYVGATRPNDPSGASTVPASVASTTPGASPLSPLLPANAPKFNAGQLYQYVLNNLETLT